MWPPVHTFSSSRANSLSEQHINYGLATRLPCRFLRPYMQPFTLASANCARKCLRSVCVQLLALSGCSTATSQPMAIRNDANFRKFLMILRPSFLFTCRLVDRRLGSTRRDRGTERKGYATNAKMSLLCSACSQQIPVHSRNCLASWASPDTQYLVVYSCWYRSSPFNP